MGDYIAIMKAVVNRIKDFIRGLFKIKAENFLVIESIDNRIQAVKAKVDFNRKEIKLKGFKLLGGFGEVRRPIFPIDKVILALDSSEATTIESLIRLKRSRPLKEITEEEMDQLIFRGLWEFLNRYRNWAAKKMGVSDLDLILANIDILDVSLGSHQVFNPLGFKGGELFLRLRGTFVPRVILPMLGNFRKWAKNFVVVEGTSILAAALGELADFVVHSSQLKTTIFSSRNEERAYIKGLSWGGNNLINSFSNELAVDSEVGSRIMERYINNQLSDRVARFIDRLLGEEFKKFLENLEQFYSKKAAGHRPIVHFNFRFNLPAYSSWLQGFRGQRILFDELAAEQGFKIVHHRRGWVRDFLKTNNSILALLTHQYSHPQYEFLNRLLRRRAKWLIPHP